MAKRNAMLARMETICAEVMDMPEIFLDNDDDDDSLLPDDCDENANDQDEDIEQEESSDSGKKRCSESDEGVSVKVNCEDKKQRRYAKWISRALRAAVNPIVSKLNLSLKVNLDLNVANKGNDTKQRTQTTESSKMSETPPRQVRRRSGSEMTRIRELENEKKDLEKMLGKIVSGYKDMKDKLATKSAELDNLSRKHDIDVGRAINVEKDNSVLKDKISQLISEKESTQSKVSQLVGDLAKEKENAASIIKQFEAKLADLRKQHEDELKQQQNIASKELIEAQNSAKSKEIELKRISDELRALRDLHTSDETHYQKVLNENKLKQAQLEMKLLDLMQKNRGLASSTGRSDTAAKENMTVKDHSSGGVGYTCPMCGGLFSKLGDLQIHTENCIT